MGTAFLTVAECPVHENYQQAILQADDTATVVLHKTKGGAIRGLKKNLTDKEKTNEAFSIEVLKRATDIGDTENGAVMAGQIAGLFSEVKPAKALIEEVYAEAAVICQNIKID